MSQHLSSPDLAVTQPRAGPGSLPITSGPRRARRRPGMRLAGSGVGLASGIALIVIATMVLHGDVVWRWLIGLFGVYVCFRALDAAGRIAFGARFEVGVWLAMTWIGTLVLLALLAGLLPLQSPYALPLHSPTLVRPALFSAHPLGTDTFGREYLARAIYGARVSLGVGFGCTIAGLTIGGVIGVLAGYYRGKLEGAINILTDFMLAFPPLVFLLALVAIFRPGLPGVVVGLTLLTIPSFIRLARANTIRYTQQEFITAARALGATDRRVILHELSPIVFRTLVPYGLIVVPALIVAEASLSFLGLSVQLPYPTWGNMIAESQTIFDKNPHSVLVAGTVLFLTVISLSRIGEWTRTRAESRS